MRVDAIAPFGVEVAPDALLNPDESTAAELRRLFDEHGLLVCRGLDLSMEQQKAVCRTFGPVLDSAHENFLVSNTRDDGYLGREELLFHIDLPYLPMPYLGGSLHALEVSPGTTSTMFADARAAWDRLPEALRRRIEPLNALNVKKRICERPHRLEDMQPGDLCTVHAVVRRHERTGRPYLFVNHDMTACVTGLVPEASDALLAELFGYLYAPDNVYEHEWRAGDLVIWDNLAVQHARGQVSAAPRTLQRVSIARIGYAQMYPTDLGIMGDHLAETLGQGVGAQAA